MDKPTWEQYANHMLKTFGPDAQIASPSEFEENLKAWEEKYGNEG